jgi:hypothetical protein
MRALLTLVVLAGSLGAANASRATGALRCAPSKPAPPVASRAGASTSLVPPGADAVLLCGYAGLNPPAKAGRLTGSRLVTAPAEVKLLTRELDAIAPTPPGVVFSCPMDDGSEILAVFAYPSGAADPVTVSVNGCTTATNGHVTRMAGAAIVGRLEALVR